MLYRDKEANNNGSKEEHDDINAGMLFFRTVNFWSSGYCYC